MKESISISPSLLDTQKGLCEALYYAIREEFLKQFCLCPSPQGYFKEHV